MQRDKRFIVVSLIKCTFAFQFVIKAVEKKSPDFVFYAPKIRINKLVSTVHSNFFRLHLSRMTAYLEVKIWSLF